MRRAARARTWWNDRPSDRDYVLGAVFSRLREWWFEGKMPELSSVRREEFESMTRTAQQRFLKQVVVRMNRLPESEVGHTDGTISRIDHEIEIEFVDGTYWPSRQLLRRSRYWTHRRPLTVDQVSARS